MSQMCQTRQWRMYSGRKNRPRAALNPWHNLPRVLLVSPADRQEPAGTLIATAADFLLAKTSRSLRQYEESIKAASCRRHPIRLELQQGAEVDTPLVDPRKERQFCDKRPGCEVLKAVLNRAVCPRTSLASWRPASTRTGAASPTFRSRKWVTGRRKRGTSFGSVCTSRAWSCSSASRPNSICILWRSRTRRTPISSQKSSSTATRCSSWRGRRRWRKIR